MALAAKNKKWLGYTVYVVLITLALLYLLFPTRMVEEFVDSSLDSINPQLGFAAEKISPAIPAGLRINNGRIHLEDSSLPAIFQVDSLYIGPHVMQLLKGDYSFDLSGRAYQGEIKGALQITGEDGETLESTLNFTDLDLAAHEFLPLKLQHRVSGKFSGDIAYSRDSGNRGEEGKADLRLTDGLLQFKTPLFGIDSVDLRNIGLELNLRNREITIVRAELAGTEINATMAGSIQLQPDMERSQLNLKGTLEPLAEFYRKYPEVRELLKSMQKRVKRGQYFFSITGTLGAPRFRLL